MISSKTFVRRSWLAGILLMSIGAGVGTLLTPTTTASCTTMARSMTDIFLGCASTGLPVLLIKMLTVIALSFPIIWFAQTLMELPTFRQLRDQMLTGDGNDSPAILVILGIFAMGILVNSLAFTGPANYLVSLLWKFGEVFLLANIFAFPLIALIAGITSFEELDEQFRTPGTNTAALFIGFSLAIAALLV